MSVVDQYASSAYSYAHGASNIPLKGLTVGRLLDASAQVGHQLLAVATLTQ